MSPQLRESPETMNRQEPAGKGSDVLLFSGDAALCAADTIAQTSTKTSAPNCRGIMSPTPDRTLRIGISFWNPDANGKSIDEQRQPSQREKICDEFFAGVSQHAFGMELHAFDGMEAVAQAHDGAGAVFLGSPGADFQFRGQIFFLDDERMIARGRHGHGQAPEDRAIVMHDGAGFAVHEMSGANHVSAEGLTDGLMSEADSAQRDFSGEVANQFDADARLLRRAGAGRDDDLFRAHVFDLADRDLIVAANLNFGAQFSEVLHQVVGEGIVVVEYEDQCGRPDISLHR